MEKKMKNYSFAMYPTTHKIYMELKEEKELTHDEMIRLLVKYYQGKDK